MSLVTRYFSTAAAGSGDGTSWANRAALTSGTNWSSIITGFDFAADSLECRIGPGPYTLGQALIGTTWTGAGKTAPSVSAFPLWMVNVDANGALGLTPDPDWTSDQPAWDASGLPLITTTVSLYNQGGIHLRGLKITGTLNGSLVTAIGDAHWCQFVNTGSNTSCAAGAVARYFNCYLGVTGANYAAICSGAYAYAENTRFEATTDPSGAGNHYGVNCSAFSGGSHFRCTIVGAGSHGFYGGTGSNQANSFIQCLIANCGGDGIRFANGAGQVSRQVVAQTVVTGCTSIGVNAQSAAFVHLYASRLRDNAGGNYSLVEGYPLAELYETDSDDATEYNNAAGGDYRIKAGLPWSDRGIGVSQMAAAGGGGLYNPFQGPVRGGLRK